MKYAIYLYLFLILFSCQQEKKFSNSLEAYPVLSVKNKNFSTSSSIYTEEPIIETFGILNVGPIRDSITVNYNFRLGFNMPPAPPPPPPPPGTRLSEEQKREMKLDSINAKKQLNEWRQNRQRYSVDEYMTAPCCGNKKENFHFTSIDQDSSNLNIKIIVDTTQLIFQKLHWSVNKNSEYSEAYPVYILNKDDVNIQIGTEYVVHMEKQAKDQKGDWKRISHFFIFGCGNGLRGFVLPPNELIVSSSLIYEGDFQTDIRLKLGNSYSNTYRGTINKGQFIQ